MKTVKELMENFDKNENNETQNLYKLRDDVSEILTKLEGQENEYNMNLLSNTLAIYMLMASKGDIKFHAHLMETVLAILMETFEKGAEL